MVVSVCIPTNNPAIPLLSMYPNETGIEKDTGTPTFIISLITIARTWKHPKCPLEDEWIRKLWYVQFSSVQSLSRVRLFATPWIAARQASLSISNSRSLLKLMPIESVMPSSHLILCRPLLLLPPILPSIRVFSNESSVHMRWPKDRSFSFSISPSNEHPGLISFRMDWLDLLAVQGYYSAIKRNAFESVLMRLVSLEPITQSEVSQKGRDRYVY